MNLPADDDAGQAAESSAEPAAESGVFDPETIRAARAVEPGPEGTGVTPGAGGRRSVTRRTLDEVFGDVLPTVTRDELDDSADRSSDGRDQWYQDNRPPHHG